MRERISQRRELRGASRIEVQQNRQDGPDAGTDEQLAAQRLAQTERAGSPYDGERQGGDDDGADRAHRGVSPPSCPRGRRRGFLRRALEMPPGSGRRMHEVASQPHDETLRRVEPRCRDPALQLPHREGQLAPGLGDPGVGGIPRIEPAKLPSQAERHGLEPVSQALTILERAEAVAVGIENAQARQETVNDDDVRMIVLRDPGQRQDGLFEASVSRTVSLDPVPALEALADVVAAETGVKPLSRNVGARHPTARFHLDGGEFVLAGSSPRGEGRSSISLTWGRMPDGSRVAEIKATM